MAEKKDTKTIATNRQVRHEFFVDETFETGISLSGTEVKSLRAGTVNLKDSWVDIGTGELVVKQMHISPYEKGNIFNKDPMRERKLLMHRREINRLYGMVRQQGYTLIPLSLYFKGSLVKLQLGLCRGKKLYDKREDMAKRDAKRDIDRVMKERQR
ncbi:MAG: SsrA-binding protein [Oscillospiraceae bacterium]|jgi:SsrA-binding protein|nr:SsrA-binding protein [Oscillospiraceae bacterium]